MTPMRIGIVGGGPAGLVAAIAGRRLGFDVTVFEQASSARTVGGGVFIHSNGQRVLDALGLLDGLRRRMRTTQTIAIDLPHGARISTFDYRAVDVPLNCGAIVMRYVLQEALLNDARLAGATLAFEHRCVDVDVRPTGAMLQFGDGSAFECDVAVAADGIHSRARDAAGLAARLDDFGEAYLRGISQTATADSTMRELWFADGRRFGICPLLDDRTYFYCTIAPRRWDAIRREELTAWKETWQAAGHEVRALLSAVDWDRVSYDEPQEVLLDRWYRAPLFVVGDAAHAMLPYLGQGANAAMVDALVLMRLLAARDRRAPLEEVGRLYEAIRRPFVTRTQDASRQIGRMASDDNLRARFLQVGSRDTPAERRHSRDRANVTAGYNPREEKFFEQLAPS